VCQVLSISTKQLQHLNITLLQTREEELAFFINLFNLLIIHTIMLVASDRFDVSLGLTISKLQDLLNTAMGRSAFFHLVSYKVGQLGKITAFDVYNHIIVDGLPNEFFGLFRKTKGECSILKVFD